MRLVLLSRLLLARRLNVLSETRFWFSCVHAHAYPQLLYPGERRPVQSQLLVSAHRLRQNLVSSWLVKIGRKSGHGTSGCWSDWLYWLCCVCHFCGLLLKCLAFLFGGISVLKLGCRECFEKKNGASRKAPNIADRKLPRDVVTLYFAHLVPPVSYQPTYHLMLQGYFCDGAPAPDRFDVVVSLSLLGLASG